MKKILALIIILFFNPLFARDDLPRGAEIEAVAGHCFIGPFGATGDVGEYQGLCGRLTSAEKCLAYLKQHIGSDGELFSVEDQAKAVFCLKSVLGRITQ